MFSGLAGAMLASFIRLELAYPGSHFFKGDSVRYIQVISSHGLVMIFYVVVPIVFGLFANYFIPYHIQSKDVAFPRLNSIGFWLLPAGFILMAKPAFTRRQVYKHWDPYEAYRSSREDLMRSIDDAIARGRGDDEVYWTYSTRPAAPKGSATLEEFTLWLSSFLPPAAARLVHSGKSRIGIDIAYRWSLMDSNSTAKSPLARGLPTKPNQQQLQIQRFIDRTYPNGELNLTGYRIDSALDVGGIGLVKSKYFDPNTMRSSCLADLLHISADENNPIFINKRNTTLYLSKLFALNSSDQLNLSLLGSIAERRCRSRLLQVLEYVADYYAGLYYGLTKRNTKALRNVREDLHSRGFGSGDKSAIPNGWTDLLLLWEYNYRWYENP
jgi:hypothetical protein